MDEVQDQAVEKTRLPLSTHMLIRAGGGTTHVLVHESTAALMILVIL